MSRRPTGKVVSSILPAMSGMSESLSVDGYKSYLNEEVSKELTIVKDKTNLLYSRMFRRRGRIRVSVLVGQREQQCCACLFRLFALYYFTHKD
jgi:hypothetical protein